MLYSCFNFQVVGNITIIVLFVNHAPTAVPDDNIVVYHNSFVTIDTLANDFDRDGGILIITYCRPRVLFDMI